MVQCFVTSAAPQNTHCTSVPSGTEETATIFRLRPVSFATKRGIWPRPVPKTPREFTSMVGPVESAGRLSIWQRIVHSRKRTNNPRKTQMTKRKTTCCKTWWKRIPAVPYQKPNKIPKRKRNPNRPKNPRRRRNGWSIFENALALSFPARLRPFPNGLERVVYELHSFVN